MKIGILGSGVVGQTLASGFIRDGHEAMIGSRDTAKLAGWKNKAGAKAHLGSFADAAKFGELIVIATKWTGTKAAIELAGDHFDGKIVMDVTNPLLFEAPDQPPVLALGYPESAGKHVQGWLYNSKVVKAFNTVPAPFMTEAKFSEGSPDLFICGNEQDAKDTISKFAKAWGWNVIDLGDMEQAYLVEALAMVVIRYGITRNHWQLALRLLKK